MVRILYVDVAIKIHTLISQRLHKQLSYNLSPEALPRECPVDKCTRPSPMLRGAVRLSMRPSAFYNSRNTVSVFHCAKPSICYAIHELFTSTYAMISPSRQPKQFNTQIQSTKHARSSGMSFGIIHSPSMLLDDAQGAKLKTYRKDLLACCAFYIARRGQDGYQHKHVRVSTTLLTAITHVVCMLHPLPPLSSCRMQCLFPPCNFSPRLHARSLIPLRSMRSLV